MWPICAYSVPSTWNGVTTRNPIDESCRVMSPPFCSELFLSINDRGPMISSRSCKKCPRTRMFRYSIPSRSSMDLFETIEMKNIYTNIQICQLLTLLETEWPACWFEFPAHAPDSPSTVCVAPANNPSQRWQLELTASAIHTAWCVRDCHFGRLRPCGFFDWMRLVVRYVSSPLRLTATLYGSAGTRIKWV